MDKKSILQYKSDFDSIVRYAQSDDGKEEIEVWYARELQTVLGYARWENFVVVIRRAVDSCKSQGVNVKHHFREVTKMVQSAVVPSVVSLISCLLAMLVISSLKTETPRKKK